jgi:hypothetical protein
MVGTSVGAIVEAAVAVAVAGADGEVAVTGIGVGVAGTGLGVSVALPPPPHAATRALAAIAAAPRSTLRRDSDWLSSFPAMEFSLRQTGSVPVMEIDDYSSPSRW